MMAIGQLLGDGLGVGGTLVSLISIAFVSYAIRSATGVAGFEKVARAKRRPAGSDPGDLSGRKIFRNR